MRFLNFSFVFLSALASISSANEIELEYTKRDFIFSDPTAACAQLGSSLSLENVTVNFATYVPAGTNLTFTSDYGVADCLAQYPFAVVTSDMCRVAMDVSTSNRSGITLEAWLPTNWTGRFLSTGNGGVSGCIQYSDLAYTAGMGFATVG